MGSRRKRRARDRAEAAGRSVAERVAASAEFLGSPRVVLYAALADELPTRPLYELARAREKTLLWPRARPDGGLEFAPCPRWEDLIPERYGVLAPPPERGSVPLGPGDLLLVPGVAFDLQGGRLGRGGGHFDRALAELGDAGTPVFGIAFECQLVDRVPRERHDRTVAVVVTECRLHRVGKGAG